MIWEAIKNIVNSLQYTEITGAKPVDIVSFAQLKQDLKQELERALNLINHDLRKINVTLQSRSGKHDPKILDGIGRSMLQLDAIKKGIDVLIDAADTGDTKLERASEIEDTVKDVQKYLDESHQLLEILADLTHNDRSKTIINMRNLQVSNFSTPAFSKKLEESLMMVKSRVQDISTQITPATKELLLKAKVAQHKYQTIYKNYLIYKYYTDLSLAHEKMSLTKGAERSKSGNQFTKLTEEIDQLFQEVFKKAKQQDEYVDVKETAAIVGHQSKPEIGLIDSLMNAVERDINESSRAYMKKTMIEGRQRVLNDQTQAFQSRITNILALLPTQGHHASQTMFAKGQLVIEIKQAQQQLQQAYDALKLLKRDLEKQFPLLLLNDDTKQSLETITFQIEAINEQIGTKIGKLDKGVSPECKEAHESFGLLMKEEKEMEQDANQILRRGYEPL